MHMGKKPEQRQGPQQAESPRRHDQRPRIDDGQRHRQPMQAQQADPPTLDSGQTTTTDHRHPSAATIDSSTEDPTPGADHAQRPDTAPTEPRQRTPRPDDRASAHTAQDAHRPGPAALLLYTPSAPTARHEARPRPMLDHISPYIYVW